MRHSVPDEASLSCTYSSFSHSFPHFSSPTKWECVTFLSTREEKLRGVHFQTCTREASISARVSRTPAISVPLSELTVQSAWETTIETHLPQSRRWKLAEQYWNSQAEKKKHTSLIQYSDTFCFRLSSLLSIDFFKMGVFRCFWYVRFIRLVTYAASRSQKWSRTSSTKGSLVSVF